MPVEKTDAIILKSFKYGDTSKIARCYTRDFGKISIIGKGIRKGKALRSAYFDPLSYLSLLFYHNPKRELQIFSKAEFKKIWHSLRRDVKKLSYGFAVLELVDRSVTGEEPHEELYQLLVDILQYINDSNGRINKVFWFFEIHLLSLLGFRPRLSDCPHCHNELTEGQFSGEYGELLCNDCYDKNIKCSHFIVKDSVVSHRAIELLKKLKRGNIKDLEEMKLQPGDRKQVGGFLNNYLKFHLEGIRDLKSLQVLEKIIS